MNSNAVRSSALAHNHCSQYINMHVVLCTNRNLAWKPGEICNAFAMPCARALYLLDVQSTSEMLRGHACTHRDTIASQPERFSNMRQNQFELNNITQQYRTHCTLSSVEFQLCLRQTHPCRRLVLYWWCPPYPPTVQSTTRHDARAWRVCSCCVREI